ncbi:MAG: PorP/SprF family type IX secretion system membrane protein [Bacteroidales bacterium]|jgi:type IX secretion system PorP/SprF family membrane protein|nr:PorP/SprF family type IX secretion system membrane protein [Bacteroidales bacterium]
MKKYSQYVFVCMMGWVFLKPASAQDPQFSQYYSAPLVLSPSFAGNSLGSRAFVNYRDQWAKLPGSFVTYSLALDNNFYRINSGIGLVVLRDMVGAAKYGSTMVKGLYSYRFNFNEDWRIRPGISFSWEQRSISFSRVVFPDQITSDGETHTSIETLPEPFYFFDAGASAVIYNKRMWFGLDVNHLMRPNISLERMDSRAAIQWSQFGGVNFRLNRGLSSSPEALSVNYLFKAARNFYQFDAGVNWYRSPLMIGVGWRGLPAFTANYASYDAVIFTVGLTFNNISVGYSYDFTVSSLGPSTGGSHEITFTISFNEGQKSDKKSSIPCPDTVRRLMFVNKEPYR